MNDPNLPQWSNETPYERAKRTLVPYIHAKIHEEDWHAVWDAAIDLMVKRTQT
jgi:hypothetical protein